MTSRGKKLSACGAAIIAVAFAVYGCGSGPYTGCIQEAFQATGLSAACFSCIQSNCSSYVSGFESACSAGLSCACPGGNYSATAADMSSCQQMFDDAQCTAYEKGNSGSCTACNSECTITISVTTSSSSSGG